MLKDTLKSLRESKGLTKKQVASGVGLTDRAYIAYEYGERDVSTETLSKLADFYGVTTDYLLGREPAPNPFADLNLSEDDEKEVMDKYMSLPPEIRACMLDVLVQLGDAVKKRRSEEAEQKLKIRTCDDNSPDVKTTTQQYINTAARSSSNIPPHNVEYTDEMLKRIEEAEEVPDDL